MVFLGIQGLKCMSKTDRNKQNTGETEQVALALTPSAFLPASLYFSVYPSPLPHASWIHFLFLSSVYLLYFFLSGCQPLFVAY